MNRLIVAVGSCNTCRKHKLDVSLLILSWLGSHLNQIRKSNKTLRVPTRALPSMSTDHARGPQDAAKTAALMKGLEVTALADNIHKHEAS
jgi:hypothetical protein